MSACPELLRVLVVDQERAVADSLVLILRARGYKARAAYSSEQAISLANDLMPHALIFDDSKPVEHGVKLGAYFERHYPQCNVFPRSRYYDTQVLLKKVCQCDRLVPRDHSELPQGYRFVNGRRL